MTTLDIRANEPRFPTAKTLYGLFFEDINRSGDGGLYPEMLHNRAFDDGIIPDDLKVDGNFIVNANGYRIEYCGGEGTERWIRENNNGETTDIPGWYADGAKIHLDREDTLNTNREAALSVHFDFGGRIRNIGYAGVPAKVGEAYHLYFFAKTKTLVPLTISLSDENGIICGQEITVSGKDFIRYDTTLVATRTTGQACFVVTAPRGGQLSFGFFSLMPAVTYCGHGLRIDLAAKLEDLHPAFFRFPGGCIVEGLSDSTVMRFSETVGPVWERKGHINLWQYRMTNGLGYHEYLQLCEDLNAEALYVCNCGMTCQARECILLEGEALNASLEEALSALEYAIGPADSHWGALRARMGHPAPFNLNYLEIGNENHGEAYEKRYEMFRNAILDRYPHLKIIANTHVERSGLQLDVADEHFYNRTEWFSSNTHHYDSYDRQGPDIFVGEFAVVTGPTRTQYPAVGEAMFMIGLERNQDIVKLAAYAPLFENVHYCVWSPNLIAFDNLRCYALPSYYVWRMFSQNRGTDVLPCDQSSGEIYPPYLKGGPALMGSNGLTFRNAVWNGENVYATHELLGHVEAVADGFRIMPAEESQKHPRMHLSPNDDRTFIVLGEDESTRTGVFEIEVLAEEGRTISVGICCSPMTEEGSKERWTVHNLRPVNWTLRNGKSTIIEGWGMFSTVLAEECPAELSAGVYHSLKMLSDGGTVSCYLDGILLQTAELPHYEMLQSVALADGEDLIVKVAHIGSEPETVEIRLDCEVESEYTVQLLANEPTARNTLEQQEQVCDQLLLHQGAAKTFVYQAPPYSVSVLRLRKC